jgi:hypothetical protein
MRYWHQLSSDASKASAAKGSVNDPFLVPQDRIALVIQNGHPERFYPPGLLALPLGQGKVEVRLLAQDTAQLQTLAPPNAGALNLPFERSFLHVDGDLVGIVKAPPIGAEESTPVIETWEGFNPRQELHDPPLESSRACLTEPLRTCIPAAGICCGARMAA